jgi:uncharacterized protein (TIGR02300 family)
MAWRGPRGAAEPRKPGENGLAKTDLGDKQVCPSCGAKFYDLRRRPATCPKCATAFDPSEESVRVRRGRSRVSANDPAFEDEEDTRAVAVKADDDEEDIEEETPAIDAEADAEPIVTDEDGEDVGASGDELPEGFSEEEADLADSADDDSVPMLEDDEEFSEDEIGEIPAEDDEDNNR